MAIIILDQPLTMSSLYRSRNNKKDVPINKISIAWFGHDGYERTRTGLENVRSTFSRKYSAIQKIPFPMKAGMPLIMMENRVVSKVEDVPLGIRDADLPSEIDPRDLIRKSFLNTGAYRYVPDNVLKYSKLEYDNEYVFMFLLSYKVMRTPLDRKSTRSKSAPQRSLKLG